MPRPPKFNHPLRLLRKELRKSQPQFARVVGASASLIKKIEIGQRDLSDSLARRISAATGVDPLTLTNRKSKPNDICGRPYSAESLSQIAAFRKDRAGAFHQRITERAAKMLFETALQAASERGKSDAFLLSFNEWLLSALDDFNLAESAKAAWRQKLEGLKRGQPMEKNLAAILPRDFDAFALRTIPTPMIHAWQRLKESSTPEKSSKRPSPPHP